MLIANPRTPVRFRYPPPLNKNTIKLRTIDFNGRIGKDIWNNINAISTSTRQQSWFRQASTD